MTNLNDVTIVDVAKAAGVSVSTVSRILNGKLDVAKATREHVQNIISELGYTPHAQAQRLRAGSTRNIALLFPLELPGKPTYNALEMDFIVGAAVAAGENKFYFNLLTTPVTQQSLQSLYRSAQVDGVALMNIHTHDWRVELLRQHQYPFVMIGHCDDNNNLSFIDLDFDGAVVTAFDHLVELGHREIGFIALPQEMRQTGFGPALRAWSAYDKSLQKYGLSAHYLEAGYATQDLLEAALSLIDSHPQMTAFVTTHEFGSLSIIQAMQMRGRRIPEDYSLVALMT
ncbi:MAG: LacI family DNA-binding transcriptional regulator, partial [Anaerolineae bacterium]|nr:LacI family DNA-binding transcriptional regulator [Anaerolineae bacterium]